MSKQSPKSQWKNIKLFMFISKYLYRIHLIYRSRESSRLHEEAKYLSKSPLNKTTFSNNSLLFSPMMPDELIQRMSVTNASKFLIPGKSTEKFSFNILIIEL